MTVDIFYVSIYLFLRDAKYFINIVFKLLRCLRLYDMDHTTKSGVSEGEIQIIPYIVFLPLFFFKRFSGKFWGEFFLRVRYLLVKKYHVLYVIAYHYGDTTNVHHQMSKTQQKQIIITTTQRLKMRWYF